METIDGSDSARQITRNSKTLIKNFSISPNAKWVAFTDKNEVLRIADMDNGNIQFTYDSSYAGVQELVWSPDSRYLTFTHGIANLNSQICLYDVRKRRCGQSPLRGSTATALHGAKTANGCIFCLTEI